MFEYSSGPQPVRCLQQHWCIPKDQSSRGGQLSVDEPSLPERSTPEPATRFTLVNTRTTAPRKRGSRTTLLSSQAQHSRRSLSSAGVGKQGHSLGSTTSCVLIYTSPSPTEPCWSRAPTRPDALQGSPTLPSHLTVDLANSF